MQATPSQPLPRVTDFIEIPQPKYPVGTRVDPSLVTDYTRPYYIKSIRNSIVRAHRKSIDRLRTMGLLPEMTTKKMLACHKARIRELFNFMKTADSVVVAGHAPGELQSLGNIANQCYLAGGAGFGAMSYNYYFMFRKNVDGRELIYTHPEALMNENNIKFCLVEPETA